MARTACTRNRFRVRQRCEVRIDVRCRTRTTTHRRFNERSMDRICAHRQSKQQTADELARLRREKSSEYGLCTATQSRQRHPRHRTPLVRRDEDGCEWVRLDVFSKALNVLSNQPNASTRTYWLGALH